MHVIPAMPYPSTGIAGCLVDPEINRGARKLVRTPGLYKKKVLFSKLIKFKISMNNLPLSELSK
jgi:hypothetical protein